MARRALSLIASSVFLLAWGCGGRKSPTEPIVRPVSFQTVYQSKISGIHAQRGEVVLTADRWAAVWAEIHQGESQVPAPPAVDFSTDMIVLAAAGDLPDGCWNVQIANVTPNVVRVNVEVAITHPPVGCGCAAVVVQPVDVVRARKLDAPGVFDFYRTISGSCGT